MNSIAQLAESQALGDEPRLCGKSAGTFSASASLSPLVAA